MVSVPSGLLTCLPSPCRLEHRVRSIHRRLAFVAVPVLSCLLAAGRAGRPSPTILVLGDSLSAGYGIRVEQGWVALLQGRLQRRRLRVPRRQCQRRAARPPAAGWHACRARCERHRPAIVILELGGNDGLRGLPIADVRAQPRVA